MNTLDIQRILRRDPYTTRYFVGVFPSDKIPPIQTFPAVLVINTDKHTDVGSHWLALFIEENRTLEFFDSYGLHPETYGEDIARFVMNYPKLKYNTVSLQSPTSNVCGQYCIYFLVKRCQGFCMNFIVCNLTGKKNDFRMYQFVKKRYGVNMIFKK